MKLGCLFSILLVAGLSVFQTTFAGTVVMKIHDGRTGVLDNKITYYVLSTPWIEGKSALGMVVKTGSLHETREEVGVAHFLEHLCATSVKGFEGSQMLSIVDDGGLNLFEDCQAFTASTKTVYKYTYLAGDLLTEKRFADYLCAVMDSLEFTREAVDRERLIILKERKTSNSNMVNQTFTGTYFENHTALGSVAQLQAITPERVRHFYEKWYRTDNIAVVMLGNEPVEEMERRLKSYFERIESHHTSPLPNKNLFGESRSVVLYQKNKSEHGRAGFAASLIWRTPLDELKTPGALKNAIAKEMVGQMLKGVIEEQGKENMVNIAMFSNIPETSSINAQIHCSDTAGYCALLDTIGVLRNYLEQGKVSPSFLKNLWKAYTSEIRFGVPMGRESRQNQVLEKVFSFYIRELPWMNEGEYRAMVDSLAATVTPGDIAAATREIFAGGYALLGNFPDYGADWAERIRQKFETILPVSDFGGYMPVLPERLKILGREVCEVVPLIEAIPPFSTDMLKRVDRTNDKLVCYELNNGMKIVWRPDALRQTLLLDNQGGKDVADLCYYDFLTGLSTIRQLGMFEKGADEMGKTVRDWGMVTLALTIGDAGITLSTAWEPENIGAIVQYITGMYMKPIVGMDICQTMTKRFNERKRDPLASYNAYFKRMSGNVLPIENIAQREMSTNDLNNWLADVLNPASATLYIQGETDIERVIACLSLIGMRPLAPRAKQSEWIPSQPERVDPEKETGRTYLVNRMYKQSFKKAGLKEELLNGMVAEYMSRKILQVIRTEKGLIYSWGTTPYTEIIPYPFASVSLRFMIIPELYEQAIGALDELCRQVYRKGVPARDLDGLKRREKNRFLDSWNNPEEVLPFIDKQMTHYGHAVSDEVLDRVLKSITIKDLNTFIRNCLSQPAVTISK